MSRRPDLQQNLRLIARERYDDVIQSYLSKIRDNPHIRAVYQIGSIGNPGISDVDLVVVVDGAHAPYSLNALSVFRGEAPDSLVRYIFPHDVYLFDSASFEDIHYSIYADDLTLLYGEPQPLSVCTADERRWLSLQILLDFTALRLGQFKQLWSGGTIDARGVLLRTASIRHSCRMLRDLGVPVPSVEDYSRRVAGARDRYADLEPHEILGLFEESFVQFSEVARKAAACFAERALSYYSDVDVSSALRVNPGQLLRFTDRVIQENSAGSDPSTIHYPKAALFHYLAFTRVECSVGYAAARQLAHAGDEVYEMHPGYEVVLRRRLEAISMHHQFLSQNSLAFAMKGVPGFVAPSERRSRRAGRRSVIGDESFSTAAAA